MNDLQKNFFIILLIQNYYIVSSFFTQSLNRFGTTYSVQLYATYVNRRDERRRNNCPTDTDQRLMDTEYRRKLDEFPTNRIILETPPISRRMDNNHHHPYNNGRRTSQPPGPNSNRRGEYPPNANHPPKTINRRMMNPSTSSKEELMQFYDLKEIILQTNPYDILQVTSNDKDELKQAYRRLAFKFHPDKVLGENNKEIANEAFKKINHAYNTLLNGRARSTGNENRNDLDTGASTRRAAVGQEEYFYPRGEDWYRKFKERERAVYTDFDPAMYEENSNSVGSIFTEVTEYIRE